MRALHWFRRDLRLEDNRALHAACSRADDGVVGLYVISRGEWEAHDEAGCKVDFWLRNLRELQVGLEELNIPLIVVDAGTIETVPGNVLQAAKDAGCDALYLNREYEINELRRDERTAELFEKSGMAVHPFDDRTIVVPGDVVTKEGKYYTVFTPFQERWLERIRDEGIDICGMPRRQPDIDVASSDIPERVGGFDSHIDASLWPAGEAEAKRRLQSFVESTIDRYKAERDSPGLDSTSALSPYLAAGVISPRVCFDAAAASEGGALNFGKKAKRKTGPGTWMSELVWREFYIHISRNFPRVCMGRNFRPGYDDLPWSDDDAAFEAWCEGQTGYPFVDAAMRQLNETGWMHNRCRMVVAMFLTKHLLIDWRKGERQFMRRLVDGDLGSNNGGWQWSASTGTDAAPYFRIYNPTTQGERYDEQGVYIRRWVPELADVEGKEVHDP
ncbi:MAG: deoxyribodipyrimidine photo-lyase, partial [Planctomycetota bacterium]